MVRGFISSWLLTTALHFTMPTRALLVAENAKLPRTTINRGSIGKILLLFLHLCTGSLLILEIILRLYCLFLKDSSY